MSDFEDLVNLADRKFGATVLYANDDFFASKDNLLAPQAAVFIDGKYTDRGKWMDGWESKRKREPELSRQPFDFAIVRLGLPGRVRGVVVDTAFFKGNYPESCALEGAAIPGYPETAALLGDDVVWTPLLPRTGLAGDAKNRFAVEGAHRVTHLRLRIFPDGGVARLRVHGDVMADPRWRGRRGAVVDLAAAEHGAVVTSASDMFFGSRHNLVMPGRAVNMGDGWETKRSRREGPDWVVVALAASGTIERVVLDTLHFKGNSPESAAVCVSRSASAADDAWTPLLGRTRLLPHTEHVFDDVLLAPATQLGATHARLRIWPDGGVSRMRLFGQLDAAGRETSGLAWLDALTDEDLSTRLLGCCGSRAWAARLLGARPFGTLASLKALATATWLALPASDHEEAFRAHPRIGEKKAAGGQSAQAAAWSGGDQAGVAVADAGTLAELARTNAAYEQKFGRIYIVCATGRTAEEMLEIARRRLENDPVAEAREAALAQDAITLLRLAKLVLGDA